MSLKYYPKFIFMLFSIYLGCILTPSQVLAATTYTITVKASTNGSISPATTTVSAGAASPTFTITPDTGYQISSVTVCKIVSGKANCSSVGVPPTYQISDSVNNNYTISAAFSLTPYTITATQTTGGSISPAGVTKFNYAMSKVYTIKPEAGNTIASVTVDNNAQIPVPSSYTFPKGEVGDHTITATYASTSYTITAIQPTDGSGSISPSGVTTVNYTSSQEYTISPSTGYKIASVLIDGKPINGTPSTYTFKKVDEIKTISATFSLIPYTIKATQSSHGSITPAGTTKVNYLTPQTYMVSADSGYLIASVDAVGAVESQSSTCVAPTCSLYTFSNVVKDASISAKFVLSSYSITATTTGKYGIDGTITPSGTYSAAYNSTPTFTITPLNGYQIASITAYGKAQPITSSFTFKPITADETISVTFKATTGSQGGNVYTITAAAGPNGSISPPDATTGSSTSPIVTTFALDATPTYTITPATGYQIATLTVDGQTQSITSSYTFAPVTSNQTINATFVVDPTSAINAFYNNAIGNGYVASTSLLSTAVSEINSLQQSDYNAYTAALTLLVNDLTSLANDAITQYQTTPNNTNLQIAINDVTLLQPYNTVLINGVGAYDNAVNTLTAAVTNYLANNNDIQYSYSNGASFNTDNSFASDVAIDGSGNVYISSPSDSTTSFGTIYEIQKNPSKIVTIMELSPVAGDHFGRLFAVSGNTLVASSEPVDGQAQVYVFTLQNNQWVQQTTLPLTTLANISQIHQIDLALSSTSIVVGLPEYGEYLVFDQNTAANTPVNDIWQLDLQGSLTANNVPVAESLAAEGGFIVIGAPLTTGSFVRILDQTAGDSTHIYNWSSTDVQSSNAGFGTSVSITGTTSYISLTGGRPIPIKLYTITQVAVGSPKENNGAGAVYILTGSTSLSTKVTTWSDPQPLNLVMNSSTTLAGSQIAINDGMLLVGANPATVMVYKLYANNQWLWAFTSGPQSSVVNSLATNGATAVIGNQNTSIAYCSDYTGSGTCTPSYVEFVQP